VNLNKNIGSVLYFKHFYCKVMKIRRHFKFTLLKHVLKEDIDFVWFRSGYYLMFLTMENAQGVTVIQCPNLNFFGVICVF